MASSSTRDSFDVAPPPYEAPGQSKKGPAQQRDGVYEPLLSSQYHQPAPPTHSQSWSSQPQSIEDLDDFAFGTTVASSSIKVRHAFIAKVYSMLFCQILGTVLVGGALYTNEAAKLYVQTNGFCFWIPFLCTLVTLVALYSTPPSSSLSLGLLGAFTLSESLCIGTIVTFYESTTVLLALVITLFLVLGLTLFAFQTKYDFASLGGYLYGALLAFCLIGLATLFFPFSSALEALYAGAGVMLFSLLLIYDTQNILRRLSPGEEVFAVISLYLDIIQIFLNILRLLSSDRSD